MSYLEVPPFDVLTKQRLPYEGFGAVLPVSEDVQQRFEEVAKQARDRIGDVFSVRIGEDQDAVRKLEDIIAEMWSQDWNPEEGNFDLFVRDFGSIFTRSVSRLLGGRLVFRSETDLSHLSCWWRSSEIEAFPFHKVHKRLSFQEGESLPFFFSGLQRMLKS